MMNHQPTVAYLLEYMCRKEDGLYDLAVIGSHFQLMNVDNPCQFFANNSLNRAYPLETHIHHI